MPEKSQVRGRGRRQRRPSCNATMCWTLRADDDRTRRRAALSSCVSSNRGKLEKTTEKNQKCIKIEKMYKIWNFPAGRLQSKSAPTLIAFNTPSTRQKNFRFSRLAALGTTFSHSSLTNTDTIPSLLLPTNLASTWTTTIVQQRRSPITTWRPRDACVRAPRRGRKRTERRP